MSPLYGYYFSPIILFNVNCVITGASFYAIQSRCIIIANSVEEISIEECLFEDNSGCIFLNQTSDSSCYIFRSAFRRCHTSNKEEGVLIKYWRTENSQKFYLSSLLSATDCSSKGNAAVNILNGQVRSSDMNFSKVSCKLNSAFRYDALACLVTFSCFESNKAADHGIATFVNGNHEVRDSLFKLNVQEEEKNGGVLFAYENSYLEAIRICIIRSSRDNGYLIAGMQQVIVRDSYIEEKENVYRVDLLNMKDKSFQVSIPVVDDIKILKISKNYIKKVEFSILLFSLLSCYVLTPTLWQTIATLLICK